LAKEVLPHGVVVLQLEAVKAVHGEGEEDDHEEGVDEEVVPVLHEKSFDGEHEERQADSELDEGQEVLHHLGPRVELVFVVARNDEGVPEEPEEDIQQPREVKDRLVNPEDSHNEEDHAVVGKVVAVLEGLDLGLPEVL
jgi:hypothetical protein